MTAQRRIQKELIALTNTPVPNASVTPIEDQLYKWEGKLTGPAESAYKGGVFSISIEFPVGYPFKAPAIKFTTKIYHPNVDDDGTLFFFCFLMFGIGSICVDILKSDVSLFFL